LTFTVQYDIISVLEGDKNETISNEKRTPLIVAKQRGERENVSYLPALV
jgi:hypothetical protein